MQKLAIIGTAGRFPSQQAILNKDHMAWMRETVSAYMKHVLQTDPDNIILVSGGSSWSDHVAVQLFNEGSAGGLELCLPASFDSNRGLFDGTKEGKRLNDLHRIFSNKIGSNTLDEITQALEKANVSVSIRGSFYQRNRLIAEKCDEMVAFGFDADKPSGGTLYTWNLCNKTKTYFQIGCV